MEKEELYELKYVLADYIYPRLKAFKDMVDNKKTPTLPNFKNEEYFKDKKVNFDLMSKFWSEKLEEMIFPFQYYSFTESFENMDEEAIKENIKKGLETFAKYFDDLWI
ncbi:hypothetical protein [Chryseobacterium sp. KMC2]|uniref:hypothetical protein n=1 Tax=Chryseobacterium sp. KMC2 TaxID=2800705 RepID=UPI001921ADBA|nr:hypothetical protein [Chryseobacterium sp. KMC2]MBL3548000.1 hypothetical protein [Chryseobacterium sp. KMC2]